mmetsp:Transcript_5596/g.13648  ORF Transcript_5596/g.13648 Transcript_5596/m.13648 type:complete len:223 (+) Transcript_5596:2042-2710(+)
MGSTSQDLVKASAASISGFTTNSSFCLTTRTAAIGPLHGMSERCKAADAPLIAATSAPRPYRFPAETRVVITWHSEVNPFGKSGRSARSIARATRVSSLERMSVRLKLDGILPKANSREMCSTVRGRKSFPPWVSGTPTAVHSSVCPPRLTITEPSATGATLPVSNRNRPLPNFPSTATADNADDGEEENEAEEEQPERSARRRVTRAAGRHGARPVRTRAA